MDARPDSSPTVVAADGRTTGTGKGSRGCLGCFASSSLGCGAFVFGAILAVAAFAPQLLGGWAARGAEAWLSEYVDGRLTIGGAELSWGDGTRLREVVLADEDDRELLRFDSVRGPSLTEILSDFDAGPPLFRARLQSAHLTVDEARGLDLARVLRWQGPAPLAALWRQGPEGTDKPYLVSIDAREVRVVDEREGGYELVLEDLMLDLERALGARATNFSLTCGLVEPTANGAPSGSLSVSLHVGAQDQPLPGAVTLRVKAERLPARAALLLLEALRGGFDAELPEALTPQGFSDLAGAHLDLELVVQGDVQSGAEVSLSLATERGEAHLRGRLLGGVLRLGTGAVPIDQGETQPPSPAPAQSPLQSHLRWQVQPELARQALTPLVPAAWALAVEGDGGATPTVRARIDSLVLDLGFGRGWDLDRELIELIADVPCEAALTLSAAPAARPPDGRAPATLCARDPLVLVRWLGPLGGTVTAHWPATEPGVPSELNAHLLGSATLRIEPSLAGDGVEGAGADASRLAIDVDLPGLPVELLRVAASLPPEGAALLGDHVRVQVTGLVPGTLGARDGALDFALYAGVGRVPVRGRIEAGVARAVGDGPQSLSFPGDRATLVRLLGPVLPWIDELQPAGPGPITVTFGELAVPLDGGALRPRGWLEFAPPPLRVHLAASIAAEFATGEAPAWTTWHPRKVRVELNDEVMRYASIELPLAGEHFPFAGSYDRSTREVSLAGEVPIRLVSFRDWGAPELASQIIEPDVRVFVSLGGTIESPRLTSDHNQLQDMLSRGVEQAWEKLSGALDQLVPRTSGEQAVPVEPKPTRAPEPPGGG